MKVTCREIVEAAKAAEEIGKIYANGKTSYKLAKNMKAIRDEMQTLGETELKLFDQYVDKDEDGNPILLESGAYQCKRDADYKKEWEALLDTETEIAIKPLTVEELEPLSLSNATLSTILFMIEEE